MSLLDMSETELEATLAGTQDGVEPVITGHETVGKWTGQELARSLAGLASSVATGSTAAPRSASSPPQPFVWQRGVPGCSQTATVAFVVFGVQQRAADFGGRWNLAGDHRPEVGQYRSTSVDPVVLAQSVSVSGWQPPEMPAATSYLA